jgi:BlaR1 peptidase M56
MIPYILYVALIITACLIFYKLLLQKETFFHLNRFILLSCVILAFILPVLPVPQQLSLRKAPVAVDIPLPTVDEQNNIKPSTEVAIQPSVVEKAKQTINAEQVMQWLIWLYWFGVIIFGLNFLLQAVVLLYTAYSKPVITDGKFRIVEITGDKAPCSFANNIFINPEKYDWDTYNQVLLHEKIHIEQKHTLDLLLAEIVLIFQWFNPFAWQWRKELETNLEFFTDNQMLHQHTVEKESYQVSLLKVAAPHFPLSLTTNYNQSLLKKRLVMMNAKKSNVHTTWKYFFLLPLMVLFVCLFNEPVAQSQNIAQKTKTNNHQHDGDDMKTEGNWFATIKGEKINIQFRNDEDENSSSGTTFLLNEFNNLPRDQQGAFTLTREAGTMNFTGKFEGDKGMGKYKFTPDKTYSSTMQKEGVDITTDRDLMVFFIVNIKKSYVQMLKQQGYTDLDKDKLIPLAALDVNEAYITSIKQAGFKDIDLDNLVPFRALNIDKAYIEEIRNAGYKNLSPDKVITFKAQGIDGKYIADYRSSVKNNNSEKDNEDRDLNENKNLNAEKNNNLNNHNNKDLNKNINHNDDEDIIAFKSMNIDKDFINSFKEVGYNDLSNSDLIAMKSLGVTPEYIKTFQNAGYKNINSDDLVALKSQDVTPALIKEYKQLGFADVSIDDVIGAKATGTSPAFIKSMRGKGHNMKSLDKYIALKSVLGN